MPGDTLWEIASEHKPQGKDIRKYIDSIKRVNGKHVSSIQAGEVLVLPN
ncbi:LysM peptidoglycan-binding domain-containing protein [Paenibacillus motobuensis]